MRILAVIPARGGSKGIPKKNLRVMSGLPLLVYAIRNATESQYITDVFVTTDNDEIADVARQYRAGIIKRDKDLSSDTITLDPVVYHALLAAESKNNCQYDVVITLQPTAPLLQVGTLDEGIRYFLLEEWDTVISIVNYPRLLWKKGDGKLIPLYRDRKDQRQQLTQYLETGAFVISKRECLSARTRIGRKISGYEIPTNESIDIRDKKDWILAESLMKRKKIIFRVDGYIGLGMGHIYNCMTMAYSLMMEHDILLVLHDYSIEGIKKVKESNLPYRIIRTDTEIEQVIQEFKPDIWVNDCLNTEAEYIHYLKKRVQRVVTIEDLGSGIEEADAVINALYGEKEKRKHIYSGYKYICLREEFQVEKPRDFSDKVRNIIIMFGGTDPSNLNQRLYKSILKFSAKYTDIKFQFITGIGYDYRGKGVVTQENKNIFVYPNVPRVSKYMKDADLAITSQGRAIFELVAMGVPSIVLSQNEREQTHCFAQMENGFLNLGVGKDVEQSLIENTLDWLIHTTTIRRNMYNLMMRYSLRSGVERVKNIILGTGEEDE